MAISEWIICEPDEGRIYECVRKFNISSLAAAIVCARKWESEQELFEFINGSSLVQNPFDFVGMDKLVQRVRQALEMHEKICIYGDYDADGITASALMCKYLRSKSADVICYIPERNKDGYGLNKSAIDFIKSQKVNLIFTVDNGITAVEEARYAKSLGMDVVITDHHRVHEKIPDAVAVVDPYRKECENLKYKNFAGVGVAFKAVQALEYGQTGYEDLLKKYSDLVAIGTIGDSIKLFGETREIVKYSLQNLNNSSTVAMQALVKSANLLNKELSAHSVAFGLVPRINACGRMNNALIALNTLLCDDFNEAFSLCEQMNKLNECRKEIENQIFEAVELLLINEPERKYEEIIVAEGENWDHGVIGIVASRITMKYGKPCVLITIEGNSARGSCRSINNFSIYNVLAKCSKYLTRFGGHPQAAGFSVDTCNIGDLKIAIKVASAKEHVPSPQLCIDAQITPNMMSGNILNDLEIFKPFGNGNPEPVFGFFNLKLVNIQPIAQNKHLRLTFHGGGQTLEALYFNKSTYDFLYSKGDILDIAATLNKNEYRGIVNISVYIVDLKLSNVNLKEVLNSKAIYERFKRGLLVPPDQVCQMMPTRDEFVKIYKYLRLINNCFTRVDLLNHKVFGGKLSFLKIYILLDILEELGVINVHKNGDEYKVNIRQLREKVNIEDSNILKSIKDMQEGISNGGQS